MSLYSGDERRVEQRPRICRFAESDMTPCYRKDGEMCLTGESGLTFDRVCVGCGKQAFALDDFGPMDRRKA